MEPQKTSLDPAQRSPHYILITFGTAGDMHPFLSLANALQARGHGVTFIGLAVHAAMVQPLRIPFVFIGDIEDYHRVMSDPDLWHPRKGFSVLFKHQGSQIKSQNDIAAYFESLPSEQPYIVLAHPMAVPSAAVFRGHLPLMRLVGVYLAPSNLRTVHDVQTLGELRVPSWMPKWTIRFLWSLVERFYIDPAALASLNPWRNRYGLPAIPHYMDHIYSEPDASVVLFPDWFGKPQVDWPSPMLMGTFPLFEPSTDVQFSSELMRFLNAGDAPIVFAPGSGHAQATGYFAKMLEVVVRLKKRAIFLTPYPEQLPPKLPAQVLWQSYVPFDALLPKVAALVHHGGIGTTAQTLRAGVPQLVIPFAFDQFDNAARVEVLGCGLASKAEPRASVRYVAKKLKCLLDSATIAQTCKDVALRFSSEPSVDEVCTRIEAMAAT